MTVINGRELLRRAPIVDMLRSKERLHGVSHGLAEVGYDIRIKQDIYFHPTCFTDEKPQPPECSRFEPDGTAVHRPGLFIIASAMERFQMPPNLVGIVHDKSTWARQGLSVFNTVIEAGWTGYLTLELRYHGSDYLHIPAGAGIAQVLFHEVAIEARYDGKYQHQVDRPVEAIPSLP